MRDAEGGAGTASFSRRTGVHFRVAMRTFLPFLALWMASCPAAPTRSPKRPAIVIVLDASGSMAGAGFDALKTACLKASNERENGGDVGILTFSALPAWAVEVGPVGREASGGLAAVKAVGASDLPQALAEAFRVFDGRPGGRVIVVSDGQTREAGLEDSVRRLRTAGIAVSAVCVGASPVFDAALMSRVADWGGGRFLFTHRPESVAKVLLAEARR